MDVDKMFKLPALPSQAGQKRKYTDKPSPDMLKRYRPAEDHKVIDIPPTPPAEVNGKGKARRVTIADEDDEASGYADADTAEDVNEDDEEGRFFGGGLNTEQKTILDIFDKAGDEAEEGDPSALTLPAFRRQLGRFERVVAKNAEQRGKFPDDPSKFIESESDLDTSLRSFLPLTQNPALFYPELIRSGVVALLCNLLSHENTDIAIDVCEIVRELTDEDVGQDDEDLEGHASKEGDVRRVMAELIDELLNNSLLDLLVSNIGRLHEEEETDRQGIFHILGVFENLVSFIPPLAEQVVSETKLLPWLLDRVARKEYDSNKQYGSEILAMLLQQGRNNVMALVPLDGMEVLLKVLSQYRNKDPEDSEEVEFMENIFNCLCTALAEPEMKALFLDAEGVELMIIMMKERLLARTRAIKVLAYALQGEDGEAGCERFVEMLGLKTFFSAFMGRGEGKKKAPRATFEDTEHYLSLLSSLFTNLASDQPPRIRLIAKFVENDYEKVDRLLEMRETAESRTQAAEVEVRAEQKEMRDAGIEWDEEQEEEWMLRRLERGGAALQNADYVLGWVCMEDDGAMRHTRTMLARKGQTFEVICKGLEEFARNIGDEDEEDEATGDEATEANTQRVVISQLINFLRGS